jgi:glycerol-3-phosphate dehydrogenase
VADHLERLYGDEAGLVLEMAASMPDGLERIHPQGPDVWAQVAYAFESEWARSVDDVLRRRTTVAVRGLATEPVTWACEQRLPQRGRDAGDERAGRRQRDRAHSRTGP